MESSTTTVERRLAAILFADVAGYSRLMGADDVGTHAALAADLKQVVDPEIAAHRGRLVKSLGDGVLIEFASAVDAVSCAVAIQRVMLGRNAELPEDRRIQFRAGINIGDVIVDAGDIFGDGVDVAARLEALAEAGGLCISDAVYEQVRDKLPFAFSDRGEQMVKNIARPVHVWALGASAVRALGEVAAPAPIAARHPRALARGAAAAAGPANAKSRRLRLIVALLATALWLALARHEGPPVAPQQAGAPRFSIVVLPFATLGGDQAQDYLADIITENVTTGLARLAGTFVIARTTAFTYKGKPVDVRQIGRDLDVRYVLEGSVQQNEGHVRVNAQLVSAETGAHLWADQFDADRSELFRMQDEIVTRLARSLEMQLVVIEAARVSRAHPGNLDAEDLAMRCEAMLQTATPGSGDADRAYGFCRQALALDPRNVRASINLASEFINRVLGVQSTDREGDIRQAEELVSRTLAIDPNLYSAHLAKCELLMAERRFEEAITEAERALALNPSYVFAYSWLSNANSFLGRPDKGVEYAEQAMRLSPRDPFFFVFEFDKGFALQVLGQDEQAIEWLRRAVAAAPEWPLPQAMLAASLALTGNEAEARATLQRYLALNATKAKTLRQWAEQTPSENKAFLAYGARLSEGLSRAGMAKE